ncbi:MAG: hypothetical protein NZM43_07790 [Saprospiraceae bacterium]|nr:hypothetical protein [Saprospiraceae bacterium]MDW8484208.1 hypothetical protein [Saprospiraceae bacterium]
MRQIVYFLDTAFSPCLGHFRRGEDTAGLNCQLALILFHFKGKRLQWVYPTENQSVFISKGFPKNSTAPFYNGNPSFSLRQEASFVV